MAPLLHAIPSQVLALQELRAAEDAEFETFYTANILLNEGMRG